VALVGRPAEVEMEGDDSSRAEVMDEAVVDTRVPTLSQGLEILCKGNQADRLPGRIMLVIIIRTTPQMVLAMGTMVALVRVVLEASIEDLDMDSTWDGSTTSITARALIRNGTKLLLVDTEELRLGTTQGLMAVFERGALTRLCSNRRCKPLLRL
jgi:hypothetical protein